MPTSFSPNLKQQQATALLSSSAQHILLYGGSRSGKTFLFMRAIAIRAMLAPNSRHAALRYRFNHIKASIIKDTFPKMMRLCFPDVKYKIDHSDWYAELGDQSQIWFGGLDEKERTEKILGQEYATIFLNEISQIDFEARNLALTRLAQNCSVELDGIKTTMRLKMYYDCNPPPKSHWSYKLFIKKVDPTTNLKLKNPELYASLQVNPADNVENLPPTYLATLAELPRRMQDRFLRGEYVEVVDGALWSTEVIDKHRVDEAPTDLMRVVVAIDPPATSGEEAAECGIIVAGTKMVDGKKHGYVLADYSMKGKPDQWAKQAIQAYRDHSADRIVAEVNNGGEMIEALLQHVDPTVSYKAVRASRGKITRAEPISALYDNGLVHHVGQFVDLEDQQCTYVPGQTSPDRMDAGVWALTDLFDVPSVSMDDAMVFGESVMAKGPWG